MIRLLVENNLLLLKYIQYSPISFMYDYVTRS
jgi:hypothetical protein